jgi:hypothetical protein
MTRLIGGKFRTKVTLVLRGDALRPEFWTAYFGVPPDFSVRKGELSRSPNGKLRETPHFWGVWNYRCQSKNIVTVDEGVMLLMKALKMPRRDFKKALSDTGCEAILSIFVDNSDGKNPGHYGQITSDFLASTGAELNLDVVDPD